MNDKNPSTSDPDALLAWAEQAGFASTEEWQKSWLRNLIKRPEPLPGPSIPAVVDFPPIVGPLGDVVGVVESIEPGPDGLVMTGRLTGPLPEGSVYLQNLSLRDADEEFYPASAETPPAIHSGIDRTRARLAELKAAEPRPDLERLRALAEYSQTRRAGHDDEEFARAAYLAAGGPELSPWRAFQAGLRAAVSRLES